MSRVLDAIARHALGTPRSPALGGQGGDIDYATLQGRVSKLAAQLQRSAARVVALHADNGPDWVVADLAVLTAQLPCIPLPLFFTAGQIDHATASAGVDAILTDRPAVWQARGAIPLDDTGGLQLLALPRCATASAIQQGTAKITFTSGSTGTPKGVCLPADTMDAVAASLAELLLEARVRTHLCLLPLPVLLENVAGVYASLHAGLHCRIPALDAVGLSGSQGLAVQRLLQALELHQPHSVILLPQVLGAILAARAQGAQLYAGLRLAAVGGARVGASLVERARAGGIPVFEGYGLSECGSVVAVNRPGADRPGSVGRTLPHARVRIAESGEIHIRGPRNLGYLGGMADACGEVASGDLGHLDAEGFLHVDGRSKNLIISSFGRNISPEWVEGELLAQPGIAQCMVHGDDRPHLCALIVAPELDGAQIASAVSAANAALPDYARIGGWIRAEAPFSVLNGQLTANGRLRRSALHHDYAARLDAMYAA